MQVPLGERGAVATTRARRQRRKRPLDLQVGLTILIISMPRFLVWVKKFTIFFALSLKLRLHLSVQRNQLKHFKIQPYSIFIFSFNLNHHICSLVLRGNIFLWSNFFRRGPIISQASFSLTIIPSTLSTSTSFTLCSLV